MNHKLFLTGVTVVLTLAGPAKADLSRQNWTEVLYQAFQVGALSAEIILHDRHIRVPMGWRTLSADNDPEQLWTIARWDGGNNRQTVDRTYLVTNANGMPGAWLTKILSYQVDRDFELTCILLTYGTPGALSMRVIDDAGRGYQATVSLGVEGQSSQLTIIERPRTVSIIDGRREVQPEQTKLLATAPKPLPAPNRLQWYRPVFHYKDGHLVLHLDGRELVRVPASPRTYTTVQFMSPQRVFLDDFEMWGSVQK